MRSCLRDFDYGDRSIAARRHDDDDDEEDEEESAGSKTYHMVRWRCPSAFFCCPDPAHSKLALLSKLQIYVDNQGHDPKLWNAAISTNANHVAGAEDDDNDDDDEWASPYRPTSGSLVKLINAVGFPAAKYMMKYANYAAAAHRYNQSRSTKAGAKLRVEGGERKPKSKASLQAGLAAQAEEALEEAIADLRAVIEGMSVHVYGGSGSICGLMGRLLSSSPGISFSPFVKCTYNN